MFPVYGGTAVRYSRQDRSQRNGGSIANIKADSTFTHVVVEEEDDDY
jgi:hypothetical protein